MVTHEDKNDSRLSGNLQFQVYQVTDHAVWKEFLAWKPALMKFRPSKLLPQKTTYLLQDLSFPASNTSLLKLVAIL